ncbi:MAG: chromate transporter [Actinobacteria bacterium]|nr:MAG: chromate transporter [Actinomycetota bacterium]
MSSADRVLQPTLGEVGREWGRIGCLGFGGPPTHIALLRRLCVVERGWLSAEEFEDAVAACNLLPGPASTQLSIFCAWRARGRVGALAGGAAFIVPGLVVILGLAALFLASSPPRWVLGAGAGAGAAVAAVAVQAGLGLLGTSWERATARSRVRWLVYVIASGIAAATIGTWVVLVLLGCGLLELAMAGVASRGVSVLVPSPLLVAAMASGGFGALAWTAFKVGALSFGGGFVIVPLMQGDAVGGYHWMTGARFLNAVALGQITPGPVTHTVAAPSFAFVLIGAPRFQRLRTNPRLRAFFDGAGPGAIGAILGSAIPLARALSEPWQYGVLAGAALALLVLRRGVVLTLLVAAAVGLGAALAGAPLPH